MPRVTRSTALPVFAFAEGAKPDAQKQRIQPETGVEQPAADNGNYTAYAPPSPFDRASSDKLICARFWSHVNKNGPVHPVLGTRCWLWTANAVGPGNVNHPANSRHGQFTFRLDGRQHHVYAHRFAWRIACGPIPDGLQVLHHCDVPPCVNDAHHFVGTQSDNLKDAARKHRFTVPRTRTLSLYDRLTIYHMPPCPGLGVILARQYGVTEGTISMIRRGRFLGSGVWFGTKAHAALEVRS